MWDYTALFYQIKNKGVVGKDWLLVPPYKFARNRSARSAARGPATRCAQRRPLEAPLALRSSGYDSKAPPLRQPCCLDHPDVVLPKQVGCLTRKVGRHDLPSGSVPRGAA